jgi:hypothetical protein
MLVVSHRRRAILARAALLAGAAAVVVAPITIRNWVVYRAFVPLSINFGIVLWEGLADAGGPGSVARRRDRQVAAQEARLYDDPRYAAWWASPDGIRRDRDRVRRSLDVIADNPAWFAGAMLDRMGQMLDYRGAPAPLVASRSEVSAASVGTVSRDPAGRAESREHESSAAGEEDDGGPGGQGAAQGPPTGEGAASAVGRRLDAFRRPIHAVQRVFRATALPLVFAGLVAALALRRRRAAALLGVPAYQLLLQSLMHLEHRVTLPMHGVLLAFAGAACALVASGAADLLASAVQSARGAPARARP